jgi:heme-degrading monooxygenase HmoA
VSGGGAFREKPVPEANRYFGLAQSNRTSWKAFLAAGLDEHRDGVIDHEVFESIYNPGKLLLLVTWRDAESAGRWSPSIDRGKLRHRRVRVIRDYGMTDRNEAPQFYPEVKRLHGVAAE